MYVDKTKREQRKGSRNITHLALFARHIKKKKKTLTRYGKKRRGGGGEAEKINFNEINFRSAYEDI